MKLNFSTWLNSLAEIYGGRPAITCGTTMNFDELLDSSRRCAMILNAIGVKKGDKVALWTANGLDWVVGLFGIVMSGGVAVLMNYGLGIEDSVKQMKMVQASWAIIGTNKVSVSDSSNAVKAAVRGGVLREHVLNIENLWKAATDYSLPFDRAAFFKIDSGIYTNDPQIIVFTTDAPSIQKAVQLSSFSVLSNVNAISSLLEKDMTESLCNALPLFNSFGLMMLLTWLQRGSEVFILSSIKPQQIMDIVYQNNISGIASVSAIYSNLIRTADFEDRLGRILKTCIVGDGFTTPTEMMRFENSLKYGKFLIGYGQAECSGVISMCVSMDPLEYRASSVGRVLPGINLKIWREGTGFVRPGEIGEIVIKGPNKMTGYYGLPKEDQPYDAEGWLHTGDLGMINEFGLLELAGRIKDTIIRNGEKISPIEIETVLSENPFVREAKVFGAPHPIWGESVEACIIPEGDDYEEEALREYAWKRLPSSKIPSHFFTYHAFPLNINGKLEQNSLKADMLDKLRALSISSTLDNGMCIMSIKVGNRTFTIPSVCDTVQGITEMLSFKRKQVNRVRLAVEEMLTERIENAYDGDGEITLDIILMPEWLRIRFVDSGRVYHLDDADASISAKIILANVDAYSSVVTDSNQTGYNLDWQYPDKFDINNFLKQQGA